eukprot:6091051-Amphidinium_carterae.1
MLDRSLARLLAARVRVATVRSKFGELFCTDSKAEGELIVVGGWASGPSCGRTHDAQVLSFRLGRDEVP